MAPPNPLHGRSRLPCCGAGPPWLLYGDTTGAPVDDCTKFTSLHVVGDIVALLDAIAPDEHQVFVLGHDWGAFIAWSLCLYRPDRVKALVTLSVHFMPRDPVIKPIALFRGLFGDDHYMYRFQVPGDIEAEFAQIGVRDVVKKFLTYRDPYTFYFPQGKGFGSFPDTPDILPSWLSEEDVNYYTSKFEKNGFTGGINYYRAFDLNWELAGPWTEAQVKVPTKFIVGDLDLVYNIPGIKECVHGGGMKKYVPRLEEVVYGRCSAPPQSRKASRDQPTHSRVHQQVLIFPSFSCITDQCTSRFQMLASFMLCFMQ